MIGAIFLIVLLYVVSQPILASFKKKFKGFDTGMMNSLYWYHILFAIFYYLYALGSRSDSHAYYRRTELAYQNWFQAYGTGTKFIDFVAYPFVNYFWFTYEMMMVLFAWFGYIGFLYFYVFIKENINFDHKIQGISILSILIFLPNMHFWTVSLGKGSTIFLGLGMVVFALSKIERRKLALIFGMVIIYLIRPHIFLFIGISIFIGYMTGSSTIKPYQKMMVLGGTVLAMALLYNNIITYLQLDPENLVESFDQFSSHRSFELAKAGSGIDISNYPMALKLFTFWYRPLFFDSPGFLGIFVSLENLLYLFLTWKMFQKGFFKFLKTSAPIVKINLTIFLLSSLALSTTMSNLGLIIRQKAMVMYFLFFVILAFMDYKKNQQILRKQKIVEKRRLSQLLSVN